MVNHILWRIIYGESYMVNHIWSRKSSYTDIGIRTVYDAHIWFSSIIIYGPHMIICGRVFFFDFPVYEGHIWTFPYMSLIYEHPNTWDVLVFQRFSQYFRIHLAPARAAGRRRLFGSFFDTFLILFQFVLIIF